MEIITLKQWDNKQTFTEFGSKEKELTANIREKDLKFYADGDRLTVKVIDPCHPFSYSLKDIISIKYCLDRDICEGTIVEKLFKEKRKVLDYNVSLSPFKIIKNDKVDQDGENYLTIKTTLKVDYFIDNVKK